MLEFFGADDGGGVWESDDQDRGVIIETVPTNNGGNYGDVFGVLSKVGSAIGQVATTANQIFSARVGLQNQMNQQAFERDQAKLSNDLQRQTLTGKLDLEKYRTQAEIARAQYGMSMPGLSTLLYGGSGVTAGGVGISPVGIAVLAALGYLGYKALKSA